MTRGIFVLGSVLAAWAAASGIARAQGMATVDRVQRPGWWPTKGSSSRNEYVGPTTCVRCHRLDAAAQAATSMAHTAMRAEDSEVLRAHETLSFRVDRYAYRIARVDGKGVYSVSDGTRSLSAPLAWAFGVGRVGQSYLFEQEGQLHESRMSYYDSTKGLDFTPGHALPAPRDLEEAMSRPVDDAEARRCFGCHTTASTTGTALDLPGLIPGVTCEACHGPGVKHVAAVEQDRPAEAMRAILNPRTLDPAVGGLLRRVPRHLVGRHTAPSGGRMPTSVAFSRGLLYVLNAGVPNSVSGFTVSRHGELTPLAGSTRPLSAPATNPAQVGFSDDGDTLIVTERATNQIDTYAVGAQGVIGGPLVHPSAGPVPFGFAVDKRNTLFVSEAGAGGGASSYRLGEDAFAPVSSMVMTGQRAACWAVVTKNGRYGYVINAGTGNISTCRRGACLTY